MSRWSRQAEYHEKEARENRQLVGELEPGDPLIKTFTEAARDNEIDAAAFRIADREGL
jgi:hypothetical protein